MRKRISSKTWKAVSATIVSLVVYFTVEGAQAGTKGCQGGVWWAEDEKVRWYLCLEFPPFQSQGIFIGSVNYNGFTSHRAMDNHIPNSCENISALKPIQSTIRSKENQ